MKIKRKVTFGHLCTLLVVLVSYLAFDFGPVGFVLYMVGGFFFLPQVVRVLVWIFKRDPIPTSCLLCNKAFSERRINGGGYVCTFCHKKILLEKWERITREIEKIDNELQERKRVSASSS